LIEHAKINKNLLLLRRLEHLVFDWVWLITHINRVNILIQFHEVIIVIPIIVKVVIALLRVSNLTVVVTVRILLHTNVVSVSTHVIIEVKIIYRVKAIIVI